MQVVTCGCTKQTFSYFGNVTKVRYWSVVGGRAIGLESEPSFQKWSTRTDSQLREKTPQAKDT